MISDESWAYLLMSIAQTTRVHREELDNIPLEPELSDVENRCFDTLVTRLSTGEEEASTEPLRCDVAIDISDTEDDTKTHKRPASASPTPEARNVRRRNER